MGMKTIIGFLMIVAVLFAGVSCSRNDGMIRRIPGLDGKDPGVEPVYTVEPKVEPGHQPVVIHDKSADE